MKRNIRIRQHDLTDCGAACLVMISAHYGFHLSIAKARQLAGTGQTGTSVYGLLTALRKIGMEAKAVKTGPGCFPDVVLPAIAHVIVNERTTHFVVVTNNGDGRLTILDPASGKSKKLTEAEFSGVWSGVLILANPGPDFQTNERPSDWKWILAVMRPHKKSIALAACCATMVSVLGISVSVYVRELVDFVLDTKDAVYLNLLTGMMLVILLLQFISGIFKSMLVLDTGNRINEKLILDYYRHALNLPQPFMDSMRTGEMISRINDAVTINAFVGEAIMNIIVDLLVLIFSLALMFWYYWKLALLLLIWLPFYILFFRLTNRVNDRWQGKIMETGAALEAMFVQGLHVAGTVRKLALENVVLDSISTRFRQLVQLTRRSAKKHIIIQSTADMTTRFFTILVLWAGCYFVFHGQVTSGELVSFYALIAYFSTPVLHLLGANKQFREASIAAGRLFEIMEMEGENRISGRTAIHGDIHFRNVTFAYADHLPVLHEVNIVIPKGTITAVTGESGSGKTTLLALLLKLYDHYEGIITLNGTNIRDINTASLRKLISVVPQHPAFLEGTIADNICAGTPLNEDWLLQIVKRLGLDNDLCRMRQGLATPIHEQGTNLSGGQKQKISVARALYRGSPVLIVDEPESAMDKESENKIMQTIEWYKSCGNTVIIITHGESALNFCDNIVLLKSGSIVSVN